MEPKTKETIKNNFLLKSKHRKIPLVYEEIMIPNFQCDVKLSLKA